MTMRSIPPPRPELEASITRALRAALASRFSCARMLQQTVAEDVAASLTDVAGIDIERLTIAARGAIAATTHAHGQLTDATAPSAAKRLIAQLKADGLWRHTG